MGSRADAERVTERFNGFWLYGLRITRDSGGAEARKRRVIGVVEEAAKWSRLKEAGDELSLMQCLKSLKTFLRDWNSASFGDVDRGIVSVMKQIDELDNDGEVVLQSQEVRDKRK
ncbi:hypothetical protein V6N13_109584 [Hibiscus sabdariffa]